MCQNYGNWLAVDKVIAKITRLSFFGPPCINHVIVKLPGGVRTPSHVAYRGYASSIDIFKLTALALIISP